SCQRWGLAIEGEGISLFQYLTCIGANGVLIRLTLSDVREKSLPDPTLIPSGIQEMLTVLPMVKVSDDGNLIGIRRPDGKVRTALAPIFHEVRSQLLVQSKVLTRLEEVDVEVGKQTERFGRFRSGLTFCPFSHCSYNPQNIASCDTIYLSEGQ